ncbi:Transposase [Loktanella sp. DSM 29012]|nr:Transposase [Loktanella sp. DSM 29012]
MDNGATREVKIWGFTIPVSTSGRRTWPDGLRLLAVKKIQEGAGIRETAEEIGANKSLVALWVKKAEVSPGPNFVEAVRASSDLGTFAQTTAAENGINGLSCRITIGDITVDVPTGYPVGQLSEVLRAVRGAA